MDADLGLALNVDLGGFEEGGGGGSGLTGRRQYSSRDRFEHKRAKKFARVKGKPMPPAAPRLPRPPSHHQQQEPGTTTTPLTGIVKPKGHPPAPAAAKKQQKQQQQQQRGERAAHAAHATAPTTLDDGDRLELDGLVGLAMAREARLREEGVTGGAAADPEDGPKGGGGGVVEFGDGDDEPDYFSPAARQQQLQQRGGGGGGGGNGGDGRTAPPWRRDRGKQQQDQQLGDGAPLQRHRVGQMARAAEPVPLAARRAIFGDDGGEGGEDADADGDNASGLPLWSAERYAPPELRAKLLAGAAPDAASVAWPDLGLASSLADHLEALNFARPTKVQRLAVPCLLARRDVLVRAATGSGKTLAYLAPIVHDLVSNGSFLPQVGGGGGGGNNAQACPSPSSHRRLSRAEGTYAVVLAPTRELAVQIGDVLSAVLRRYPWVVSGLLVGGENRAHEKARLRKGVTALVATPGRLLDHLQNTAAFGVAPLRWLVLDEADRLLDMGFESKVREILGLAEQRQRQQQREAGVGGGAALTMPRRTTALLSATLHARLRALAELSLESPAAVGFDPSELLKRLDGGKEGEGGGGKGEGEGAATGKAASLAGAGEWEMPATLRQSVVEVPARDRLAALVGALRARLEDARAEAVAASGGGKHNKAAAAPAPAPAPAAAAKVVVFLSTCDGVEFHHALLTSPHVARSVATGEGGEGDGSAADGGYGRQLMSKKRSGGTGNAAADDDPYRDGLLGRGVAVLRLHGDMPQAERTSAFLRFAAAGTAAADDRARGGAVLLCTDVAARGLDFPAVTAIVQYDPPGDPADYVHRVGRTARMGQRGEAVLFSLPSERGYGELLRERSRGKLALRDAPLEPLLKRCVPSFSQSSSSFSPSPSSSSSYFSTGAAAAGAFTRRATAAVAADSRLASLAADGFRSFVRAYATHPSALKGIFHVRSLHLGHVASAFALKEPPAQLGASGSREERKKRKREEERKEKRRWNEAAARSGGGGGGRGGKGGGGTGVFSLE
jgi:ATP-dependent RNA helicase DDX31/DBP7